MPQAIAAAVVAALAITGTAAVIATAVLTLAISIGLTALTQAIFGSGVGKPSDGQRIIREAIQSRRRYYGQALVGGALSFEESRNGSLYQLTTSTHGEIDGVIGFRFNNEPITVNGSGVVTNAKYKGVIKVLNRLGTETQTAYSELTAAFSSYTAAHQQKGCSNNLLICGPVKAEEFSEVYEGNQPPILTTEIRSSKLYDPRSDSTATIGYDGNGDQIMGAGSQRLDDPETWVYSDNAALVIADYWAHDDGYGAGKSAVNWVNIAGEADECDIQVSTISGDTISKWRIWGGYALSDDDRQAVLSEMMKAIDGFSWQDKDGKLNLLVGRWIDPSVAFNEDHIIGINATKGAKAQEKVNEVKIIYTDRDFDYQEQEASPAIDQAAQLALGRPEPTQLNAYYAPHHNQAARLGKRSLLRLGDRWNLVIVTNLYGLNMLGERFCRISIDELGLDGVVFEITAPPKINFLGGHVELTLAEVRETDFDFDPLTEEGDPPTPPNSTLTAITIPSPTNLALDAMDITGATQNGVGIKATWDQPSRVGLFFDAQYKESASSAWLPMSVAQDEFTAISPIVSDNVAHDVRIRSLTISGRPSEWATASITPSADNSETAPATPTQFSATGAVGEADITWRNPTETNFGYVRLYRHTSDDFSGATQVGGDITGGLGAVIPVTETPLSADVYYYWVRSYSISGLASVVSASVTVTVT